MSKRSIRAEWDRPFDTHSHSNPPSNRFNVSSALMCGFKTHIFSCVSPVAPKDWKYCPFCSSEPIHLTRWTLFISPWLQDELTRCVWGLIWALEASSVWSFHSVSLSLQASVWPGADRSDPRGSLWRGKVAAVLVSHQLRERVCEAHIPAPS